MKKFLLILCLLLTLCCLLAACDKAEQEDIESEDAKRMPAAHTHTWEEWRTVKKASCDEEGEQMRSCTCGERETKRINRDEHTVTHHAAVAAGCETAGNAQYWECSGCGAYFSDEACRHRIKDKDSVVTPATGHQHVTRHARVEESCDTAGNIQYWECLDCDTYFSDAACENRIANKASVTISATGHRHVAHRERKEAECEVVGNIQYWECLGCGNYFSDSACKNKIADKTSVVLSATGHQHVTRHAYTASCCETAGNVEYWECTDCETYYSDSACEQKIANKASVVISATGHQHVAHHAAVAVECEAAGNAEYWECIDCDHYFSDSACEQKIANKASVVISATGHQHVIHHAAVEASCVAGNIEYFECTDCGDYFANAACTVRITDKQSVVIPATGGVCVYNTENVCPVCGTALQYSVGLEFTLNADGNSYSVSEGTALDHSTDIVIPWYHNGKPVTVIGERAFENAQGASGPLESIIISPTVKRIEKMAFVMCGALTAVTIPEGVEYIGFAAFAYCSFGSISLPASVMSVDKGAWGYNRNISSVTVANGNPVYHSAGNCLIETASKTLVMGCNNSIIPTDGSVTSIGDWAFVQFENLTSITIPSSVTRIGEGAFNNCSGLTSITIPSSVRSIGYMAFQGCSGLERITVESGNEAYQFKGNCLIETATKTLIWGCKDSVIPADGSVTSIGQEAFYYCTGLTSITVPASVINIGARAFFGCNLTSVVFENPEDWYYTDAEDPSAPDATWYSMENLGDTSYAANYLMNYGGHPWRRMKLEYSEGLEFTLNDDGNSYSVSAGTALNHSTDIVIPWYYNGNPVTVIGESAFSGCGLTSITIPSTVTSIGDCAFFHCYDLESITIPSSVTSIGVWAFFKCTGLTSIAVEYGNPVYHSAGNCLIETASGTLIQGCKNSVIPTDGSVMSIGEHAFCDCTGLTSITIPLSVTSIGGGAFSGCCSLVSIVIPASVTSIEGNAFYGCSPSSIIVEDGNPVYHSEGNCLIEKASGTLIKGCNNSVIPTDGSVMSIGEFAFDNCAGLTSITIPSSVTSIESSAFFYCTRLTSIAVEYGNPVYHSEGNCLIETASGTLIRGCKNSVIPADGSVTNIAKYAFYGCSGLETIGIPSSVTSIGDCAFFHCYDLESITIPSSVTSIGRSAFFGCDRLSRVEFEAPAGWWVSQDENAAAGTAVDVSMPETNDDLLKNTYRDYYWKHTVSQ